MLGLGLERADLAGPPEGRGRLHGTLAAIVGGWALTRPPHAETPPHPNTRCSERPGDAHRGSPTLPSAPPCSRRPTPLLAGARSQPRPRAVHARAASARLSPPPRSRARLPAASARAPLERSRELRQSERGGRARTSEKEAAAASASNRSGRRELTSSAASPFRSLFPFFLNFREKFLHFFFFGKKNLSFFFF